MKRKLIYSLTGIAILFICAFLIFPVKKDSPEFGKDRPDGFEEYMQYITGTPKGNIKRYTVNYRLNEYYKALNSRKKSKSLKAALNWVERGPGNVGGRTRALIIDPDDSSKKTWVAASVSGGIWRTTDYGQTWENLTPDLPVLSTTTLAMAPSDHNVIYAGTGEGFGGYGMVIGNGIFKSTSRGDKGSWQQLPSTAQIEDFEYINRIVVDYNSPDTVLVCTNTGIFKSNNGGISWYKVYNKPGYKVQDIVSDPQSFNTLYAGVNRYGIIKSTDKGETWYDINNGIGEAKRFELAVSPVNPDKIFVSAEGYGNTTIIYISIDKGASWHCFKEKDGNSFNYLRNQGWFDNTVACHPFNENTIYIAGVYAGQITFNNVTEESDPQVLRIDTSGTGAMLEFVSFGGRYFNGALAIGSDEQGEEIEDEDWCSVEIRIGNGFSQKAHRFIVPAGSGAGVPPEKYTYSGYIDVPFEVWDTDNNTQLMVSFRDNEQDGTFDIKEYDSDKPAIGREYLFIHGIEYDSGNPNADIAQNAGYTYKLLYFMWPTLVPDSVWEPGKLNGIIKIQYGKYIYQKGTATTIADNNKNNNLHVDHHQLIPVITNTEEKRFILFNSNDGGLGISENEGSTWKQITEGYNTTQFYGVARKPGTNEYIGGMQDNGTWQSKPGESAVKTTEYFDRLEGDGFEALWHPDYPQRIIGSTYNNYFSVTNNGGEDWEYTYDGIDGDGPFVSRLSHSLKNPNIVFAVGGRGVYRHRNFGLGRYSWDLIRISKGFSINNTAYTHDVEVSLSDPDVIWAGTGMYNDPELRIFVSKDGGESFDSASIYGDLGFITSIVTHPIIDSCAFVLFSQPEKPKILRTNNWGKTWTDISGFGKNDTSNNGFPDVITYTLLVHPEDTGILWAGTEIGLFESVNSGQTWYYADNGLPAVSVFQLKESEGQIIAATHGRGIWTLNLSGVGVKKVSGEDNFDYNIFPNPASDFITIQMPENIPDNNLNISILNMEGRTVYNNRFSNSGEIVIDISNLLPGSYIVNIIAGSTKLKKVIIKK